MHYIKVFLICNLTTNRPLLRFCVSCFINPRMWDFSLSHIAMVTQSCWGLPEVLFSPEISVCFSSAIWRHHQPKPILS